MNVSLEEAAVVERNFARRLARAHVACAEVVRGT